MEFSKLKQLKIYLIIHEISIYSLIYLSPRFYLCKLGIVYILLDIHQWGFITWVYGDIANEVMFISSTLALSTRSESLMISSHTIPQVIRLGVKFTSQVIRLFTLFFYVLFMFHFKICGHGVSYNLSDDRKVFFC